MPLKRLTNKKLSFIIKASNQSRDDKNKKKRRIKKMWYLDRYFNGKYVGTEIFNSKSIAKGFANKRRAEGYTVELKTF